MSVRAFRLVTYALVILAFGAVPAFAYSESVTSTNPADTPAYACPDCHGLESDVDSPTVGGRIVPSSWTWDTEAGLDVGSRKGPHGGYTTGTQKCQVCHTMHGAGSTDGLLLPQETIEQTCFTCHDGTGGSGVYGVIYQRTGMDPKETSATASAGTAGGVHRIGAESLNATGNVTLPGGDPTTGGSIETTFTGLSGALTCTDCHSAHNSNTVAPYVGDRKRSSEDTTSDLATNRLLRVKPTSASTTVTVYGTGWCGSCHEGGGLASNHSVETSDTLRNYSNVTLLAGLNTSSTAGTGSLGGSNLGYIMPDSINGPGGHGTELPICQQCHEDMRTMGGSSGAADQFFVTTAQDFVAPLDGLTPGNPQFQNFPHESVNDALLVETAGTDGLCLNCHLVGP